MDVDLGRARQVAIEAAEAAGALLRRRAGQPGAVRVKREGDVVTELDLLSERVIVGRLRSAFPGHRILSEEKGAAGAVEDTACTWVVDPLDGSNNLVIGLAAYCVGIALCVAGVPVLGVVHDPVARRTWSAIRGHGAWDRPDRRLRRRIRGAGRRPLLAWTQGYTVGPDDRTAGALRLVIDHGAQRVLQLWAPLLSWVMLARGDIDGLVGYRIGEVDLHAGALIASEAGIDIRSLSGSPYVDRLTGLAETRSLVAGPPEMMGRLLTLWPAAERIRTRVADLWAGVDALPAEEPARRPGGLPIRRPVRPVRESDQRAERIAEDGPAFSGGDGPAVDADDQLLAGRVPCGIKRDHGSGDGPRAGGVVRDAVRQDDPPAGEPGVDHL